MKVLKRIATIVLLLAIVLVALYFIFHMDSIQVEGTEYYTQEEICESVMTHPLSDNEIMFWIYSKIFGLNTLPFVEEIEVEYHSPRSITLHVYDKTVCGCIKYMGQYIYFDKEGIVLQTLGEQIHGIPVVTGIDFGTFHVGEAFDVDNDSVFNQIMNVSQMINHYEIPASKIIVKAEGLSIEVEKLKVNLGSHKMYDDAISALSGVLERAQEEKMDLEGTIQMDSFEEGDSIVVVPPKKTSKKKKKEEKN